MKRSGGVVLALSALLTACMPASLRTQPHALVQVQAGITSPVQRPSTGEDIYRFPGPLELAVKTDRNAFVNVLVLPEQRWGGEWVNTGAQVTATASMAAGELKRLPLAPTLGFTHVFTVASLTPLDLRGVQGQTSLTGVSSAVQAATRSLPAGSYNVSTNTFRVARFGLLQIAASELGATVDVNGKRMGTFMGTPLTIPDVPEGEAQVVVKLDGFVDWRGGVTVKPDTVTPVFAKLERPVLRGTLSVSSSVAAQIVVEGRAMGSVSAGGTSSFSLPVGVYTVQVVPTGVLGGTIVQARIRPNQTTQISCSGTENFSCSVSGQ